MTELLNMGWLKKTAFLIALVGSLGSLYFSEILRYPPCALCWYQRVFLYPLVFVFGVAIWTDDDGFAKYALPLALIGTGIAIYHNLIYYGVISEALAPCTRDISCSAKQLELFGFITIPLLSLAGFAVLSAILIFANRATRRDS